jgi:hypothetical protein
MFSFFNLEENKNWAQLFDKACTKLYIWKAKIERCGEFF